METLLRLLNARTAAAAGAVLAAGLAWQAGLRAPVSAAYERLRYPGSNAPSGGEDIRKSLDERESARLRALHARVQKELDRARAEGFNVEKLRRAADSVMALDRAPYRKEGLTRLNKLRLAIPRKSERFRLAGPEDGDER